MRPKLKSYILVAFLLPGPLSLLHAQTAPADVNPTPGIPAPYAQAPDEATRKISELVLAGKYAEAQKLTEGLLIAYPDDQRLIKAKALIDSRLSPGGSTSAAPANSQPTQSSSNANAAQLTGMDKVDYDALIEVGRQAEQDTDLEQQKASLKQFIDQSSVFLQKHPHEMLLWQLRAQAALSVDDPMAGYEAGQRLLAAGVTDSTDANARILLAQLRNKDWLDKQKVVDSYQTQITAALTSIASLHYSRPFTFTPINSEPCAFNVRLLITANDSSFGSKYTAIYDMFHLNLATLQPKSVVAIMDPASHNAGLLEILLPYAVGTQLKMTRKDKFLNSLEYSYDGNVSFLKQAPAQCDDDAAAVSCSNYPLKDYKAIFPTPDLTTAQHLRDSVLNTVALCKRLSGITSQ